MAIQSEQANRTDVSILIRVSSLDSPIAEALDALARQVFEEEFQIIIVRHELSGIRVEDLSHVYPDLIFKEVTYDSDFGYGKTLNLGIEVIASEVIILLSEHCRPVYDSWLSELVNTLRGNSDCAGVWGPLLFDNGTDNPVGRVTQKIDLESFLQHPNTGLQNSNAALRRSLWHQYRFSESLTGCEDQDWALHFLRKGWKTAKVGAAPVHYSFRKSPVAYAKKIYREYLIVAELVGHPPRMWFRDIVLGLGAILKGFLSGRMKASVSLKLLGGLVGGYLANVRHWV